MAGEYTESRLYNDDKQYKALVEKTTKFTVSETGVSTADTTKSFVNSDLYKFFDVNYFNRLGEVTIVNGVITGPIKEITLDLSKLKLDDALGGDSFTDNVELKTYIDSIDTSGNSNYVIDENIVEAAKKITNYYIASSALYAYVYYKGTITHEMPFTFASGNPDANGYDGITITLKNVTPDIPAVGTTAIPENTYAITQLHNYYKESIADFEETSSLFNANLSENIDLNKTFNKQNDQLKEKNEIFDGKKALAITMMAKAHKANKLYSSKQFWFMIYMIIFMVYFFGILGLIFAGGSKYALLTNFQSGMSGMVVVVVNASILTGLIINEIYRYFNK